MVGRKKSLMSNLKQPESNESLKEFSLLYDENYYQSGCGIPYERNEHWLNFFGTIADEIVRSLNPQKVLDAGKRITKEIGGNYPYIVINKTTGVKHGI